MADTAATFSESYGSYPRSTLPFELLNNHIYVRARVNGHEPRRFLVDTGGANLLTRTAAAELGVKTEGSFPVLGAGETSVLASITRLDWFELGGTRFDHAHPVVAGTIDGRPGSFTIDTGSRSTLDLHGPFVADHDLMRVYEPPFEAITGWGVGGGVRSSVTRAELLTLGDVQIPNLVMHLTAQTKGAFADRHQAGRSRR